MKNLIALLSVALIMSTASAQSPPGSRPSQKVGFNAANATETIKTSADSAYLNDLMPPGLLFSWRDRYDKLNEDPADVVKIYQYMQKTGSGFWDIFVASDSVPLVVSVDAVRTLKNGGVPVPAVEFVNEAFYRAGGYEFNWPKYEAALVPFLQALYAEFPGTVVALPIAPKPLSIFTKEQGGQNTHDIWNNGLFAFTAAHPEYIFGGALHLYYTGAFVDAMGSNATSDETGAKATADETGATTAPKVRAIVPEKRVYNYATDTIDEGYWRNIFYQSDPTLFWEPMLNYLADHNLPGYITEAGYIDAGALNGTWTYAANIFELVNHYGNDPRIASLNIHGGPFTRSRVGTIGPRESFDVRDTENPNNVTSPTWDALVMYFNTPGGIYPYDPSFQITEPGVYSFWYQNGGAKFTPLINIAPNISADFTVTCVKATRFSSQGVSMEANKKGSVLGVNEVSRIINTTEVPAMSFGYIVVTVTGRNVPGCTNPEAIGYDPLATTDDGSCILRVYGCTDVTALNYNPQANTPDESCIAKVYGCTNPTASNYNRLANVDDGSCIAPPPPVDKPCRGFCSWFPKWCKCTKK